MRLGLRTYLVMLFIAVACLSGCNPPLDLAAVGAITLYQSVRPVFSEHFGAGRVVKIAGATTRVEEFMSPGTIVDERLPRWAKEDYAVCVHWEDPYEIRGISGPMKKGTLHGWVLVAEDLSTHILEFSIVSGETGERWMMLDQWAEPTDREDDDPDD